MPQHLASKLVLLALAGAVMVTGCGGSVPKESAASYPAGPAGIDEALADLERGEAAIAERFGPVAGASPTFGAPQTAPATPYAQPPPGGPPTAASPAPAQPPSPQAPLGDAASAAPPAEPGQAAPRPPPAAAGASAEDDAEDAEERAERDDEARCEMACRALGSMRRAAEHVCRAAGPLDARCGRARDRVGHAERKVRDACESCDG